ncbi:MAG: hypothetical protein IPF96_18395 [Rhodobacter sp.]|nr:hypothetical protein [Rhodobacter sp.]
MAEFIAEFQRERQKERLASLSSRAETERRLAKVSKQINDIVTAITDGMYHPNMKAKIDSLEAERASLAAALDGLATPEPAALHPGLADIYAGKVAKLSAALNHEDTRAEAVDVLRGLIERVILQPVPDGRGGSGNLNSRDRWIFRATAA